MKPNIGLVGLGKLGLCLAAIYADQGHDVTGVDIQESVIAAVNAGRSPIVEPGLDETIARVGGKTLKATSSHAEAVAKADTTIILTATPSGPDGGFLNDQVEDALVKLATALRDHPRPYHLFVISSTVLPGSIESSFIPLVEKHSGRMLNQGFGMCYDPDFVALGNVIHDFRNPEIIVLGESAPEAGDKLLALHKGICANEPHIGRMSLVSAEIAKVSLNAYITMKISFANALANVCEAIPGADVDAITQTIGHDGRISPRYFRGGLAYGGTCFPRDTWAYKAFMGRHGCASHIIQAVEDTNALQDSHLAGRVLALARELGTRRVAVLGLAFKPNTPVITESPAIKLIRNLRAAGLEVTAYDPLAMDNARAVLDSGVVFADSGAACLDAAPLCVLTLPDRALAAPILDRASPLTVLDCWRILKRGELPPSVRPVPLGRAED